MKYLLAAEADRIQDLLFRSSRLREVVGGSQLLSRFCEKVPSLLDIPEKDVIKDIITSGGGSFYVEFENEDAKKTKKAAHQFGARLAEAYNRATGGTLSVADPVEVTAGYGSASEEASERLRQAKHRGPPVATVHIPYVAFCASCGVGLAVVHRKRHRDDPRAEYLCASCLNKANERRYGEDEKKSKTKREEAGWFLERLYAQITPEWAKYDWPGRRGPERERATAAEDVARCDARNYVAYIVADGNDMGRVFGGCSGDQANALSDGMTRLLYESLAAPFGDGGFMQRFEKDMRWKFIPVLPLILGGDDLFALVPAPWALDIAQRLCRTFQSRMTEFARGQGIQREITMTAAVVICKANYPYYLAHQIGDQRLSAAKRMVKALAAKTGVHLSAVDFEVVLGSQAAPKELTGERRPTLCPYWVTGKKRDSEEAEEDKKRREEIEKALRQEGWGLPIHALLEQRRALVGTPSRRLSQLREHFDKVPKDGSSEALQRWDRDLQRFLERIERDWAQEGEHPVRIALKELGGIELKEWYRVERESDEDFQQGHGMPDLLRVWEWALNLDRPKSEYEGGER